MFDRFTLLASRRLLLRDGVPVPIGEGYIGLMRAACRCDSVCGAKFATYATWWAQAAIQQSILRASPSMRVNRLQLETVAPLPPLYARAGRQTGLAQFVS